MWVICILVWYSQPLSYIYKQIENKQIYSMLASQSLKSSFHLCHWCWHFNTLKTFLFIWIYLCIYSWLLILFPFLKINTLAKLWFHLFKSKSLNNKNSASRVFFYNSHRVKSSLLILELSFRSLLQGRQTSKWQFYTAWQFKIRVLIVKQELLL